MSKAERTKTMTTAILRSPSSTMLLAAFISAIALSAALLTPNLAEAQVVSVLVCNSVQSCQVEAKTLAAFRKLLGLGGCGAVPGGYTVKVIDRNGNLVGYKCAVNPYQPGAF